MANNQVNHSTTAQAVQSQHNTSAQAMQSQHNISARAPQTGVPTSASEAPRGFEVQIGPRTGHSAEKPCFNDLQLIIHPTTDNRAIVYGLPGVAAAGRGTLNLDGTPSVTKGVAERCGVPLGSQIIGVKAVSGDYVSYPQSSSFDQIYQDISTILMSGANTLCVQLLAPAPGWRLTVAPVMVSVKITADNCITADSNGKISAVVSAGSWFFGQTRSVVDGVGDGIHVHFPVPPGAVSGARINMRLDEVQRSEMVQVTLKKSGVLRLKKGWLKVIVPFASEGVRKEVVLPLDGIVGQTYLVPVVRNLIGVGSGDCCIVM
jgi:hypothetical protein